MDKPNSPPSAARLRVRLNGLVCARNGRELMGLKSSVCDPHYYDFMVAKVLSEGKGVIVRWGLKEAGMQSYEPTDRNSVQGPVP